MTMVGGRLFKMLEQRRHERYEPEQRRHEIYEAGAASL
jgi:hypothetical protein